MTPHIEHVMPMIPSNGVWNDIVISQDEGQGDFKTDVEKTMNYLAEKNVMDEAQMNDTLYRFSPDNDSIQ